MNMGNINAGYSGNDFPARPLLLREGIRGQRRHDPDYLTDDQDDAADERHRALLCSACRTPITSAGERHEKQNKHLHTFFNPAGIVYEIGCFRKAPGCLVYGRPSTEFSWFSGYCWQIVYCRRCGQHLGWKFSGVDEFFGLIVKKLTEN